MSDQPPIPVDPSPVNVQNVEPIPVEVMQDEPLRVRTEQDKVAATRVSSSDKALAEAKVAADAARADAVTDANVLRTEDQRRISGIWERTQQVIALSVVEVTLVVVSILVVAPALATAWGNTISEGAASASATGLVFLASIANLVIGFYFGRTNHTRTGGVGPSDQTR